MKNEKTNAGFMISTVAFCLAVVVALPLRVFQLFNNMEEMAGFYLNSRSVDVYVLYFILGACIVICAAAALVYKKELGFDRGVEKRPLMGVSAIVAAFTVLYSAAIEINRVLSGEFDALAEELGQFGAAHKPLCILTAVTGVLTALYLVVLGVALLVGKTNGSEYKVLSVFPMAWFMFRLVSRFTTTISFLKVSELTLELFMLAFMLLFFYSFARLNSKIDSKGIDWSIIGYGLPAACLALLCFVPRLVMVITGHPEKIYENSSVEYCDLGTALFALTVVFTRMGWFGGNADAKEEEEEAKKAAAAAETAEQESAEED